MSDGIKGAIIGAIITGIIGFAGTITAANMGKDQGEQETINQLNSQIANVNGDNNTVTVNSVDDLISEYSELVSENKSLVSQNTKYYDELEEAKNKIEEYENQSDTKVQELEQQINDMPDVQFRDMGLSVNGEVIPINSTDSSVVINNRTYYSDEFVKSLVDSNNNITIQDNTLYIGRIIKEKSSLLNEWILNKSYVYYEDSVTDSYGNMHTNALRFSERTSSVIYNLNGEYSLLKCDIAIRDNSDMDRTGIITIKADDTVVYTSQELTKTTEPFSKEDIPINNCKLLTIEYNADSNYNQCIMDNITVYN